VSFENKLKIVSCRKVLRCVQESTIVQEPSSS
jgi:hypothetical protein